MPQQTYMGVDDRRDHQFQVPRPELSAKTGVPNACQNCHLDNELRTEHILQNQGESYDTSLSPHYSEIFYAAWQEPKKWQNELLDLTINSEVPAIIRASALKYLEPHSIDSLSLLTALLNDSSPTIRQQGCDAV